MMPQINVARIVEFGKPLEVGKADKPVPGLKDVLVKVEACCLVPNSYNLVKTGGGEGFALPQLPCVFGLDASGVVEAVGDHVLGLKPGDRVYVDPLLTCGTCHYCRQESKHWPGESIAINGVTGTLGYAAVAIALGFGCTKVLGIGRNKDRLKELEGLSPNGRVRTISSEDASEITDWINKQTGGLGPDALYDCLGNGGDANMTSILVNTLKKGGRAVLAAGGAEGEITQGYLEVMSRDVAVLGTLWFNSAEIDELIALIDAGVIDFSFLRHEFFSLRKVNEAFKFVGDRPGGAVNVVVQPSK